MNITFAKPSRPGKGALVVGVGAGRGAGGETVAKFLECFVNKVPWAHLDIAGVSWSKAGSDLVPKGGTAFGVRLLDRARSGPQGRHQRNRQLARPASGQQHAR